MEQALEVHRLHFAFTITFHYIFPQLTMGLALLLVYLKTKALRTGDEHYNRAARFWARIFGINFALGVVTGIPMEFQFGTNWAEFSKIGGRRDRADSRDGRRVFIFSRVEFSGTVFVWREKTWAHGTLVGGVSGLAGFVAFGLPDCGDGRAGCSIPTGISRWARTGKSCLSSFWGLLLNRWAALAVRAHDAGRGTDGMLRDGGGRCVLSADERHESVRADVCEERRARGRDRRAACSFSPPAICREN